MTPGAGGDAEADEGAPAAAQPTVPAAVYVAPGRSSFGPAIAHFDRWADIALERIRGNAIAPYLIQTALTQGNLPAPMRAGILKVTPTNRLGDAIYVSRICLFLGSDLSSYVTGATVDVNGGMLIH